MALNWTVTIIAWLLIWSLDVDGLPDGAPGTYWASLFRLGAVASRH